MSSPAGGQSPSAVIGLEVDGRSFDQANAALDRHLQGWERVGAHANRVGAAVDSMASRLMMFGGAVGLGTLISDFIKLDDVASRAALSVGRATGRDGYRPFAQAING